MDKFKVFIVEDDKWYADLLEYTLLLNPDYEVEKFYSGTDLLKNLYKNPGAITVDYSLGDMTGAELLKKIKQKYPSTPVVIISSQEEINVAVNLLKEGAYDYIIKNEETKDRLWNTMSNICKFRNLEQEHKELKQQLTQKYSIGKTIIGESQPIKQVFNVVEKVAGSNINVSITGETGTGKEMVARAIHFQSPRASNPFVAVNVSAIPEGLIESELFGHEKGAFTGAESKRIGKFEQANKSTLFLDEIADMSLQAQTKILRVLQEKELTRLGGNNTIKIDTRLIVATHKNLIEEVKKGNFREDLYYRLMGLPIHMPPLRERGNDIVLLTNFFLKAFCSENKLKIPKISSKAIKKLMNYQYPGNIRELKAIIELGAILAENDIIEEEQIIFNSTQDCSLISTEEMSLEEYNQKIVEYMMKKHNNKAILVAQKLKISKSTIYRILKKMDYNF